MMGSRVRVGSGIHAVVENGALGAEISNRGAFVAASALAGGGRDTNSSPSTSVGRTVVPAI